jgi:hypothetical protein
MTEEDANHLNLLGIFHYVLGGITIAGGFCPSIHLTIGILSLTGVMKGDSGEAMPISLSILFTVFPAMIMIAAWALGGVMLYAGSQLRQRQWLLFCQVVAGIECICIPLGTVLGVFTLIVLNRPRVQAAFNGPSPGDASQL